MPGLLGGQCWRGDEAADLDEGDIGLLAGRHRQLAGDLPALAIVGGCCGTDARHVDALWP